MILVLFLCSILFFIILLSIFVILSNIKIKINNLEIMSGKKINHNYKAEISLELFGKIKWIKLKLNERKIRKFYTKMHLEKIDIKELEKNLKIVDIKEIFNIKPKISYMNMKLKIGVDEVLITTYLVPIISTFLSILLPYAVENENINKVKYKIEPVYNQNFYLMQLDISFYIKIVNVLNCAYKIYKNQKGRSQKNEKIENKIKCNV